MTGVMVTGATTPVGRALVAGLLEDPAVARVLAVAVEPRWTGPASEKLTYLQADLTRSRRIRRLLFGPARDLDVNVIVHGALHRSAADRGEKVWRLNVESTRELLHLAERHPTVRRFVYRSYAEVYRLRAELGSLVGEGHPLELSGGMPQRVRDRVEADLTVCTRMGMTEHLSIAVLRCAEVLAPESGSQLHDYLRSRVCFRPLGFDPMLQVLSVEDVVDALRRAVHAEAQGVFNVPGHDVLPLSRAIARSGRAELAVPGPLLGPLYGARSWLRGTEFRYGLNKWRFHFSGVLDGSRAERVLGYRPTHPLDWDALAAELRASEA
ncbi:MAG TPA: NAD-dependent epimerase/dehydratase family protein [Sandaracinaceae bacterium LLY-WYZ-13_1]|nr:NAD-dependent epimerase/dehydratase family protein [Sandaracinaceae bacterium LLY-WYZ-13_1]